MEMIVMRVHEDGLLENILEYPDYDRDSSNQLYGGRSTFLNK